MPDYIITRNGVHYFSRRVPAKLVQIIGRDWWRETLATTEKAAARKEAAQRNAHCKAEIAIALLAGGHHPPLVSRQNTNRPPTIANVRASMERRTRSGTRTAR